MRPGKSYTFFLPCLDTLGGDREDCYAVLPMTGLRAHWHYV